MLKKNRIKELLSSVLVFCVEFRELSHLTRDLSQAEKKITVVTRWQNDNYFHSMQNTVVWIAFRLYRQIHLLTYFYFWLRVHYVFLSFISKLARFLKTSMMLRLGSQLNCSLPITRKLGHVTITWFDEHPFYSFIVDELYRDFFLLWKNWGKTGKCEFF